MTTVDTIVQTLDKLVKDATDHYYSPYTRFQWVNEMADEQWWISSELLTVAGTPWQERLSEPQLMTLSKWECTNFFSLNIHGIRELLMEVTRRIHAPGFEVPSEFFHRFLGEENGHMWFFAQFCNRYGGKIYADKALRSAAAEWDAEVSTFLVFARILIFEEMVDHFNIQMGRDTTLHPLIREINQAHHDDEWRHIVMGRSLVEYFFQPLRSRGDSSLLERISDYLCRYMVVSVESLYNPAVYRDAGLQKEYELRNEIRQHEARRVYHETFMRRITGFLTARGIIASSPFVA